MYVNCPSCDIKFIVLKSQINKNTKKLRCSKCSSVWDIDPSFMDELEREDHLPKIDSIPFPSSVMLSIADNSASQSKCRSLFSNPYLSLFLTTCLLIGFLVFTRFNNLIKEEPKLKIQDLKIDNPSNDRLILKYKICNQVNEKVVLPEVKIKIMDNKDKVLKTHLLDDDFLIKPNSCISIKTELSPVDENFAKAEVSIW